MATVPPAYLNDTTPLYQSLGSIPGVSPNIQVSTMAVNKTGFISMGNAGFTPGPPIRFITSGGQSSYLREQTNKDYNLITPTNIEQVTLTSPPSAYADLAVGRSYVYGKLGTTGNLPVAVFDENPAAPGMTVASQNVSISSMTISSINGMNPNVGPPGNVFTTLFVTQAANVSTLNVSTLNLLNPAPVVFSTLTSPQANLSTTTFSPAISGSLGGVSVNMGGVLSGVGSGLGALGAGIFGAVVGGVALGTGMNGLTQPRTSGNISATTFETVNGTTQLQTSTIGSYLTTVTRLVNSANVNTPGAEIFTSTLIYPGTTCIRSMGDPLNLANSAISNSTIQAFGQWQPVPTQQNVVCSTINVETTGNFNLMNTSYINATPWDTIQFQNQALAPTSPPQYIVTSANSRFCLRMVRASDLLNTYFYCEIVPETYVTTNAFVAALNSAIQADTDAQTASTFTWTSFTVGTLTYLRFTWLRANQNLYNTCTLTYDPVSASGLTPAQLQANALLLGAIYPNNYTVIGAPIVTLALPNPPTSNNLSKIPFGPYMQFSTMNVSSIAIAPQVNCTDIECLNINNTNFNSIASANQAPAGVGTTIDFNNQSLCIAWGPGSFGPPVNKLLVSLPVGLYNTITAFAAAVNAAITAAGANVGSLYCAPQPVPNFAKLQWQNNNNAQNNYIICWDTTSIVYPPSAFGITAAEMTASSLLFGADTNTSYPVPYAQPSNIVLMPNVVPTSVGAIVPFGPNFQLSTLTMNYTAPSPSWNNIFGFVPIGSIQLFANLTTYPTSWILCNGGSLVTSVYPALFAAIGYSYGGSGVNFTLPNITGPVANTRYYIRYAY